MYFNISENSFISHVLMSSNGKIDIVDVCTYNLGQNRWEIYTPLPLNQGWQYGAFWLSRGLDACKINFRLRLNKYCRSSYFEYGKKKWTSVKQFGIFLNKDFFCEKNNFRLAIFFFAKKSASSLNRKLLKTCVKVRLRSLFILDVWSLSSDCDPSKLWRRVLSFFLLAIMPRSFLVKRRKSEDTKSVSDSGKLVVILILYLKFARVPSDRSVIFARGSPSLPGYGWFQMSTRKDRNLYSPPLVESLGKLENDLRLC